MLALVFIGHSFGDHGCSGLGCLGVSLGPVFFRRALVAFVVWITTNVAVGLDIGVAVKFLTSTTASSIAASTSAATSTSASSASSSTVVVVPIFFCWW